MPKQRSNTAFQYLYRDASNYKSYGSIILAGWSEDSALLPRLLAAFDSKEFFIPAQLGVPKVDFETTGEFERNENDHPWHAFDGWVETTKEATDLRSPEEFVAGVERASRAGWNDAV